MTTKVPMFVIVTLLAACASGKQAPALTPSPETVAELPTTQTVTSTAAAVRVPTQPATNVPTQPATDVPADTSTAPPTNTPTALPTNTATPLPKIVPTIPATTEMKWGEISPPVGVQYEGANWIKIQAPRERTILAVYFTPEGEGPFPVVVILHGTMGLREIHVQLAQDYAKSGFVAVAGSWFGGHYKYAGGKKPPVKTEHSDDIDWPDGPDIKVGSHPEAVEDVVAFVEAARTLPSADPSRIGLYGHSRGSTAAIATATSGIDIQAVVAVAGYPKKLSFRKLEAPMLILQGTDDKLVDSAEALQFKEKLIALGKTVKINIVEGAPHDGHTTLPWSIELLDLASSFYSEYLGKSSTPIQLPTDTQLPPSTPTATSVPVETATPTGVYEPVGPLLGQQLWQFKTDDWIHSSPAISGAAVYVGSDDGHLYALDTGSGQEKWKFKTGVQPRRVRSRPAISAGVVYFGSDDRHLYALDAGSGQQKWRFKAGKGVHSSPAISGGLVYFGSLDGYLYALASGTGREKWKFKTGGQVGSSPAVSVGMVYFGSQDGHLYALDAGSGQEKWKFKTGGEVRSSPGISGGVVYFGSLDGHLYALDVETGQEKWKFKAGNEISTSPAISGGIVYFDSPDDHLYALDAGNGQEKWKVPTGTLGQPDSSPAIWGGLVYFGSYDGHLYALDAGTGQEKWKFLTGGRVHSSPVVSGGVMYFGSRDNYLYALK